MKFLLTSLLLFLPLFLLEVQFVLSDNWQSDGHHKLNCSSGAPMWPKQMGKEKEAKAEASEQPTFDPKCLHKKSCTVVVSYPVRVGFLYPSLLICHKNTNVTAEVRTLGQLGLAFPQQANKRTPMCFESTSCKLKDKKYDWISGIECKKDASSEQSCTYNCCHSEQIRVGECMWMDVGDAAKVKNTTEKVIRDMKWNKGVVKAVEVCNATFVPVILCPRDPKADPLQFKSDPSLNPAGQSDAGLLGLLGLLGLTALVALKTTPMPATTPAATPTKTATAATVTTDPTATSLTATGLTTTGLTTTGLTTTGLTTTGLATTTTTALTTTTLTGTTSTSTTTTSTTTTSTTTTSTTSTSTTTACTPLGFSATCTTDADCVSTCPTTFLHIMKCYTPASSGAPACVCALPAFSCAADFPCCDGAVCPATNVCPPTGTGNACDHPKAIATQCTTGNCLVDAVAAVVHVNAGVCG